MTLPLPFNIKFLSEVDSTNLYAIRNLSNLSDKEVICAEIQTGGIGRHSRKWISDKKDNIYLSIILKPFGAPSELPLSALPQYMSVVLCRLLESFSIKAEIKWPNDTLVDGKKLAGILCQSAFSGTNLDGFVLGLGVNLNLTQNDIKQISQPATSLNLLTGSAINRDKFRDNLLKNFFAQYDTFLSEGFQFIHNEYVNRCTSLGKSITIRTNSREITGFAESISPDGTMTMISGGIRQSVSTGEII
ncbi:MAG: biotin--[acetyl-CoA-carboxylase] ligase [Fibrobacteres bacterium]|nr:biotin--[acetyl-CoA-carboxylase] ligase [Fibrobacterota bacterium]